jgi:hypothetical protein
MNYKGYFDFSGGYNDTTVQDILKDNELSTCENVNISPRGELLLRDGTSKINDTSKNAEITRRFEYLIRDTSIVLEVYNKKLYRVGSPDVLIQTLISDKPYFLQQQDVIYVTDGQEVYEIGQKDYFSNVGTVDVKKDNIIQVVDDFSVTTVAGNFYKAKSDLGSIDLNLATYTDTTKWDNVTDIRYATSNIIRPLKSYVAGKKEKTEISIFGTVTEAGYITITLNSVEHDITLLKDKTAREVATQIAGMTIEGYTVTAKQNVVTFEANDIGYKENCLVESYNTGLSLVANVDVNGEDDDNILTEVKKCTKFIHHTKSGRYVATGNPNKPYAIYFSEALQLNYFKKFNILSPTSSEGSAVCLVNMLDSVLVGYRHAWFEYTGIDPATDGVWRRLAIPFGCAAEYSVQVLDFYNFVYLADNGLYQVSANILNQYGVVMQNNTAVKNISDDKIENTIKSIIDKTKCVSVYHNGIYYLAYNDVIGTNNKILLYYSDKKAFTLYSGIQANDFLYRKNGDLEIASKNYSLKFINTKHADVDINTGGEKRIEIEIKTSNLALNNFVSEKFIDKLFVQANISSESLLEHLRALIRIDYESTNIIDTNFQELQSGFVWGNPWGTPWANHTTTMQSTFIRKKGNRIALSFTNKGLTDIGSNIIFYGFVISYKELTPHQPISNLRFKR